MTPEEIVRALANVEPLVECADELSGRWWCCGLCGSVSDGHDSHWVKRTVGGAAVFTETDDPTPHTPTCLWVQAKAWVDAPPADLLDRFRDAQAKVLRIYRQLQHEEDHGD